MIELLTQALTSVACVGTMTGALILVVILYALMRSVAQESDAYSRAARRALGFDEEGGDR